MEHRTQPTDEPETRPLLGIGSCLAGNPVRYDGSTKSVNSNLRDMLACFRTRAFCPEMAAGMGVPRAPIHVVDSEKGLRALDVATHNKDYTAKLQDHASAVFELEPELCGYILVKGSPSCGYDRVKRFAPDGRLLASDTRGVFASALSNLDPLLPLEDDGRLNDPGLRDSFVNRAFAYASWRQLCREPHSAKGLISFYSRYKYLVMAHHLPSYKALGRLLANAGRENPKSLAEQLISGLMVALSHRATVRSYANVLQHIAGYLKKQASSAERQHLAELIEHYRLGYVPLVVPVTQLRHLFTSHPNRYINEQVFLAPYPVELKIRNHL